MVYLFSIFLNISIEYGYRSFIQAESGKYSLCLTAKEGFCQLIVMKWTAVEEYLCVVVLRITTDDVLVVNV